MARRLLNWLHRWTGLVMAGFLVIVGLTGSLLAFKDELDRASTPGLFATAKAGLVPLDLAALADRAGEVAPDARLNAIYFTAPDQVTALMSPRKDRAGRPYQLDFDQLLLDPWTGDELGRRIWGDISQGPVNLIPFIYKLHYELALGTIGLWTLGIVALAWTIDCFVGAYLTLPSLGGGYWRRWKSAWSVKWRARAFRLNFDLHRAGGLWVWPMLVIFAWSAVYMNLTESVYTWVTSTVLEYRPPRTALPKLPQARENPKLDFRAALAAAEQIMGEQAALHGFRVERPVGLGYQPGRGVYFYFVRSTLDVKERTGGTYVYLDGDSGALRHLDLPTGQYRGNTVTSWLSALHMANVFGLPYRIFVCVLGLVITMLSVTGVYIWWKKRSSRQFAIGRQRPGSAVANETPERVEKSI